VSKHELKKKNVLNLLKLNILKSSQTNNERSCSGYTFFFSFVLLQIVKYIIYHFKFIFISLV